jgi:squalene synthase HpnC
LKFSKEKLYDLTLADGGRFKVDRSGDGFKFCERVATEHYENFPVGSILIPGKYRKYIYVVYTFARIADNIADELPDAGQSERAEALNRMSNLLLEIDRININNPLFIALKSTIEDFSLPFKPFQDLLIAFKRDIYFQQAETFSDLLDYCKYSANPVGELILRITGSYNEISASLSDKICTGLQLVNFWQDFSRDIKMGRNFIPNDFMKKYELEIENFKDIKINGNLHGCIHELYDLTENFFSEGTLIINYLKDFRIRKEIHATIRGGILILKKLRQIEEKVFFERPFITKAEMFKLVLLSLISNKITL